MVTALNSLFLLPHWRKKSKRKVKHMLKACDYSCKAITHQEVIESAERIGETLPKSGERIIIKK